MRRHNLAILPHLHLGWRTLAKKLLHCTVTCFVMNETIREHESTKASQIQAMKGEYKFARQKVGRGMMDRGPVSELRVG